MSIEAFLIALFILIGLMKLSRSGPPPIRSRRMRLRTAPIPKSLEPVTPGSRYICENCGMLINTGHGHTRDECREYSDDSTNPDLRAHKTILPGSNDPKIRMPYYYEPGTFQNWGKGK